MKAALLLLIYFSLLVSTHGFRGGIFDPLDSIINARHFPRSIMDHVSDIDITQEHSYSPIYVGQQDGLKDGDKISALPGQPVETDFDQYSGYVTIEPKNGKALFYYLTESPTNSSSNPLVLWLNGGPGCSSFGAGAMMELGPFRVNADNKTLSRNRYAWNNVANVLFLDSPVGVGFSYSYTSSDYEIGDSQTAKDSYTFLVNWLERFKKYKTRDFYIAGESYAGHYIPQLAQLILQNNKITNQTVINLKGIALGNAYMDKGTANKGLYEYLWTHAIISDQIHEGILSKCNFSEGATKTWACRHYQKKAFETMSNMDIYDIYAPICLPRSDNAPLISRFDPCSEDYIDEYLNTPAVQQSLHAKSTKWESCNYFVNKHWTDGPFTVLPVVKDLMGSGISVWIYSGDTDARVPVTTSKYDIDKLQTSVQTPWYPWMYDGEVGGYVVEYQNLTFVTIRGAGHFVPSTQPGRAIAFFASFLKGKLP